MSLKYGLPLAALVSADPKHVSRWQKDDENPLRFLTPALEDNFLPTRIAQCLFIGKTYGWSGGSGGTYSWPPTGLQDCLDRITLLFPLFPRFELHIWIDYDIGAQIVSAGDDVNYISKLDTMEADIIAMCATMAAFGFVYEGRVTDPDPPLAQIAVIQSDFFSVA